MRRSGCSLGTRCSRSNTINIDRCCRSSPRIRRFLLLHHSTHCLRRTIYQFVSGVCVFQQPARVSDDERKLAAHLVNVILDHDAKAKEYDEINVVLMHGFDLGVAWWIWKYQFSGSPYEWRTGKLR